MSFLYSTKERKIELLIWQNLYFWVNYGLKIVCKSNKMLNWLDFQKSVSVRLCILFDGSDDLVRLALKSFWVQSQHSIKHAIIVIYHSFTTVCVCVCVCVCDRKLLSVCVCVFVCRVEWKGYQAQYVCGCLFLAISYKTTGCLHVEWVRKEEGERRRRN